MLAWITANTLLALALACGVAVAGVWCRSRPAVAHLLWMLVLVRLVAPPVPLPGVDARTPFHEAGAALESWLTPSGSAKGARTDEGARAPDGDHRAGCAEGMAPALATDAGPPPTASSAFRQPGPAVSGAGARDVALWIWGAGSLVAAAILLAGVLRFRRRLRRARPAPRDLVGTARRLAAALGLRPPRVAVLPGLRSPVVWAVGRPLLLWPAGPDGPVAYRCTRGILAHELAHLKRRDHWWAWLETAATVLLWWNPLLWVARRRLRHHAELACDAWVVGAMPERRRAYAEALIDVAAGIRTVRPAPAALGIGGIDRRTFERRLGLIMSRGVRHRLPPLAAAAAPLIVALALPASAASGDGAVDAASGSEAASALEATFEPDVRAAISLSRAQVCREAGRLGGAAAGYRRALAIDPADGRALGGLAHVLLELDRPEEAVPLFHRQLQLGHERAYAAFGLACASALQDDAGAAARHLRDALEAGFHDAGAVERDPRLAALRATPAYGGLRRTARMLADWNGEAMRSLESERFAAAAEAYRRVTRLAPRDGRAWHLLGYALIMSGDPDAAEEPCRRQIALGFREPVGLYNLACIRSLRGDVDGAIAYLELSLDAGFDGARYIVEDPDLDRIRDDRRFAAIRERATSVQALWRRFERETREADWPAAAASARALVEADPESGRAQAALGRALLALGRPRAAADAFRRQVAGREGVVQGLLGMGCAFALAGERERALGCLELAVATGLEPGDLDGLGLPPGPAARPEVARFLGEAGRRARAVAGTHPMEERPTKTARKADSTEQR